MPSKEKEPKLYELRHQLKCIRPRSWEVHVRYALLVGGQEIVLPVGTWLLELGPSQVWIGENHKPEQEYLFRLASGELVALDRPLASEEIKPINNPQAITAMQAYRSLDQAIFEDWGLISEHVDRLPAFRLVKCPYCHDEEAGFTTLDFSVTYCNRCHATFQLRYTAGDPGFILEAFWDSNLYGAVRYLAPKSKQLRLFFMLKNSDDPRDMDHRDWNVVRQNGCTKKKPKLIGQNHPSLRTGLHACKVGDIVNWQLNGFAPVLTEYDHHSSLNWQIEGEQWPYCSYLPVSGLSYQKRQMLGAALSTLERAAQEQLFALDEVKEDVIALLTCLKDNWRNVHVGLHTSLPSLSDLVQDERYLLHHWIVHREKDYPPTASPVWLVVKPVLGPPKSQQEGRPIENWEVVRRDICPVCGRTVTAEEFISHLNWFPSPVNVQREETLWQFPHGNCHKVWEAGPWKLYQAIKAGLQSQKYPSLAGSRHWLIIKVSSAGRESRFIYGLTELQAPGQMATLYHRAQTARSNRRQMSFQAMSFQLYETDAPLSELTDGLTGQSLEQQGYVILNQPLPQPVSSDFNPIEPQFVQLHFLEDGQLQWLARVDRSRQPIFIETVPFNLQPLAEATGVLAQWAGQYQLTTHIMAQPLTS